MIQQGQPIPSLILSNYLFKEVLYVKQVFQYVSLRNVYAC